MKKILKAILNFFVLIFMAYDEDCERLGVCDYSNTKGV